MSSAYNYSLGSIGQTMTDTLVVKNKIILTGNASSSIELTNPFYTVEGYATKNDKTVNLKTYISYFAGGGWVQYQNYINSGNQINVFIGNNNVNGSSLSNTILKEENIGSDKWNILPVSWKNLIQTNNISAVGNSVIPYKLFIQKDEVNGNILSGGIFSNGINTLCDLIVPGDTRCVNLSVSNNLSVDAPIMNFNIPNTNNTQIKPSFLITTNSGQQQKKSFEVDMSGTVTIDKLTISHLTVKNVLNKKDKSVLQLRINSDNTESLNWATLSDLTGTTSSANFGTSATNNVILGNSNKNTNISGKDISLISNNSKVNITNSSIYMSSTQGIYWEAGSTGFSSATNSILIKTNNIACTVIDKDQNMSHSKKLSVGGNTNIDGNIIGKTTLSVGGNTNIDGNIIGKTKLSVGGNTNIDGNIVGKTTLSVGGKTNIDGNIIAKTTLSVGGKTNIDGNIIAKNALSVGGNTNVNGNITAAETIKGKTIKFDTNPNFTINDGTTWSLVKGPGVNNVATQGWVESKNYLTTHQSLVNYIDKNSTQTMRNKTFYTSSDGRPTMFTGGYDIYSHYTGGGEKYPDGFSLFGQYVGGDGGVLYNTGAVRPFNTKDNRRYIAGTEKWSDYDVGGGNGAQDFYYFDARLCAYFAGSIYSGEAIYVGCDERNKHDIKEINDDEALDILRKINVYTFYYKDVLNKPHILQYNVLAQEVEKVLPQAIHKERTYLSNIMKTVKAKFIEIDNNQYKMILETVVEEIKNDKNIRFYAYYGEENKKDILDLKCIENNNTFIVDREYKFLICYGEEEMVLSVDKQVIYSLCHSGIQELDRQQLADKKRISQLEEKVDSIQVINQNQANIIDELKTENTTLKNKLNELSSIIEKLTKSTSFKDFKNSL